MDISTKYNGMISVEEEQFFHFESGLPAFEDEHVFVLLPLEEGAPFFVLQSIKSKEVAFICVEPFNYVAEYKVELPDSLLKSLCINSQEEVAILVLLTIKEPFQDSTANLQAPIVLNAQNKLGKQFVINESAYQTKQAIFKEMAVKGGE
ncbi:flagellar assembly protein FliW [Alkalihalobacillus trypoxylicola]|uniref:Flagellar assembly factor FliW n=1 Tax=Alkalihalobacillus trypoxylicola TaxID=519424 RepID=A0A162ETP6_9BACI|nr:flagellar assembly protein FliW [Alkalihalobacillus trypoxylicola]KYG33698.1 flagellar assembly protein FliW [Alkalihalobacillus trypoxylicola]